MFSFLRSLFRKPKDVAATQARILDDSVNLAMDWGESWLAPIQPRLQKMHPGLGDEDLDSFNARASQIMQFSHEFVHNAAKQGKEGPDVSRLQAVLQEKYPELQEDTCRRLFNQSLYYASKTAYFDKNAGQIAKSGRH